MSSDGGGGRVVIASDKFKGTLTAAQVADAVAAGLRTTAPALAVRAVPVADGGDGTLDAAVRAGFERRPVTVRGPVGLPVQTAYAVRGDTAIVELADACGLARLPGGVCAPMQASSHGVGDVLVEVLRAGVRRIVLGVGGSASSDGGAGMLQALGARLSDRAGRPLMPGGGPLIGLDSVDLTGLPAELAETEIILASDVDNPLLGRRGAVAVYGPQKGLVAGPAADLVEAGLAIWAAALGQATDTDLAAAPGAGAAGGVGFAAMAALGATMRPGIDLMLDLAGFETALAGAGLVITGEGSIDAQTLRGKAPAGVARAAAAAGVPVVAVCGRCTIDAAEARAAGIERVYPLTDIEPDLEICRRDAGPLLTRIAARVAAEWLS